MEDSPSKKRRRIKLKEISTALSKEELIRRLKSAAQEFTNVDQGENTSDFDEFAASVATNFILKHRDKDVKSYAACCLVDILRIYAPEPPYNEDQLKNVFNLLVQQLKGLENINGPSYKRHFYILESLALVKTFNCCVDLDAQDIITDLFKLFFTIVSEQHNARVKSFMLDIMCPLIQDSGALPQQILDVILIHLIEPRKSKYKAANKLACDILDKCTSSIEPFVQLFFNNAFVLGQNINSDLNEHLYDLVLELYKVNKNVLLSVLPQLEFKLKSNEEEARLETVKLLGQMFAHEDSALAESNKVLWNCYLGRFLDICVDIRIECVQMAKQFLLSSSTMLRTEIADQLCNRLLDPDEKVRLETVITVCEAAVENFELINEKLIESVKERMRDKKWLIRREAITCIGKLYKHLHGSKTERCSMLNIAWAPSRVLHLYQNSIDDRLCIERVLHGCFIPVGLETEERMKRLLTVYLSLDDVAVKMLNGMLKFRSRINVDFRNLLIAYQENHDEDRDKVIFRLTVAVARNLPEPHKAQDHLRKLLTCCSDKKLYQSLLTSTDVTQECPKIVKAVTEIIKKLTTKNPILETVKALLDRACPMLVDAPSIVVLLKYIKKYFDGLVDDDMDGSDEDNEYELLLKGKILLQLIQTLAQVQPSIFQSTQAYEVLLLFIKQKNNDIVQSSLRVLEHVISEIENIDKTLCSCYQPVLSKLAINGTHKQSKYALRCLNKMLGDSTLAMDRIFKNLLENMNFDTSLLRLRATLAALGEIALLKPNLFETKHKNIIRDFIVKEVLIIDREDTASTSSEESEQSEWGDDFDISEHTYVKIEAIKLLTRWLLGLEFDHTDRVMPVFRLLTTLLNHDGDLSGNGKISAINRSRLRVVAASSMLKLLQSKHFVDTLELEQYQQLALVIQDSCYYVREKFTAKLHRALETFKLPLDFMAYLVLVYADPAKDRRTKAKSMILKNAQIRREYSKQHSVAAARPYNILPEYSLPFVVHLLAHHPDFDHNDNESLQQNKEYLWFFLEPILGTKAENYSFLKKLLENIKQTKDKQDPENESANQKLYSICDLAIGCIMNKNTTFTLKDFPGNVVLPKKLFIEDKSIDCNKIYLPKGFIVSPKKQKNALDVKTATHNGKEQKDLDEKKSPQKKTNSTKRSNDLTEDEGETPKKKSRVGSSSKKSADSSIKKNKDKTNAKTSGGNAVRNLEKENTLKSPKKQLNGNVSASKKTPIKKPLTKSPKKKSVKASPKKSPVKKITRGSPRVRGSPKKRIASATIPKKIPPKKAKSEGLSKQLKMDSFINGSRNAKDVPEEQNNELNTPSDEKPKKVRKSPRKTVALTSKTRMAKRKNFPMEALNGNFNDTDSDDIELSNNITPSPRKKLAQMDEKPASKLVIRRKQRSRR